MTNFIFRILGKPAIAIEVMWLFQERSEPKGTPNIDILSQNSNELESKEMSGRSLSMRLDIRWHCPLPAFKFSKSWDPQFLRLLKSEWSNWKYFFAKSSSCWFLFMDEAMFVRIERYGGYYHLRNTDWNLKKPEQYHKTISEF